IARARRRRRAFRLRVFDRERRGRAVGRILWAKAKGGGPAGKEENFLRERGLWIYLLAALPVLLFIAYAIAPSSQQNRSVSVARRGERPLAYQDLLAVKP